MPIEVPNNPKVYTTVYDNFKGVDFTNDSTNVWRRRSPTGTNMLPDASGRPFKRHGWEILLSNEELCDILNTVLSDPIETCKINKCAYFELAGIDHIVIFTDAGVIFYGEDEVKAIGTDPNCYDGYDRSFFFDGNGLAAFYIYGSFQVWRYDAEVQENSIQFSLHEVTDEIYVPTVLIAASADCTGEMYEGYNLLGKRISVEYCDCNLYTGWASKGLGVYFADFSASDNTVYNYTYDGDAGKWYVHGTSVEMPSTIKVTGNPKDGDEIVIIKHSKCILLPNNITQSQVTGGEVEVFISVNTKFDKPLTVIYGSVPSTNQCAVYSDPAEQHAWIIFNTAPTEIVGGEDFIKVNLPSVQVDKTTYDQNNYDQNSSKPILAGV